MKFPRTKNFCTGSVEETLALGAAIARILSPLPKLVILSGEVGAGKTTLVKGVAAALDAASEEDVTSPTFTLLHEYASPEVKLYHLDLYRIETEQQLAVLGIDEMAAEPDALVLVEWGERFPSIASRADAEIVMEHGDGDQRFIQIRWR